LGADKPSETSLFVGQLASSLAIAMARIEAASRARSQGDSD